MTEDNGVVADNYRLRLGLAALAIAAFLVFAYTRGPASLEEGEARPPKVVAAAIDQFSREFPGQVPEVDEVVVPDSIDGAAVEVFVESDVKVVSAATDGEAFWRVGRVSKLADHWVVEMQAESESFFAGEIFLLVDPEGRPYRVSPEDLGVSRTTAVS